MSMLDVISKQRKKVDTRNWTNIDERIEQSYEYISSVAAQRGITPPTTVIMGISVFGEWHKWCEEKEEDYLKWRGVQIIIEQQPRMANLLAFSYHPQQENFPSKNQERSNK